MWGKRGENEKKCVCVCVCESISWNDTFILLLSHRPLFPVPLLCCLKSISPSDPISRIFSLFSFLTVRDRIIYQPVWLSGRYLAVLVPTQASNNLLLRKMNVHLISVILCTPNLVFLLVTAWYMQYIYPALRCLNSKCVCTHLCAHGCAGLKKRCVQVLCWCVTILRDWK